MRWCGVYTNPSGSFVEDRFVRNDVNETIHVYTDTSARARALIDCRMPVHRRTDDFYVVPSRVQELDLQGEPDCNITARATAVRQANVYVIVDKRNPPSISPAVNNEGRIVRIKAYSAREALDHVLMLAVNDPALPFLYAVLDQSGFGKITDDLTRPG